MNDEPSPGNGKRVSGLTAETPVGKAARKALAVRFQALADALKPAAVWGGDPEPVHKLRVAARRASAALDTFADLIAAKVYRRTRRVVKRLRRSAGAARDADVFLDTLRGWSVHQSPAARPGLHFLLGHAFAQRQHAQKTLNDAVEDAKDHPFSDLPDKVRSGVHETLEERAARVLSQLIHDLEEAARTDLEDYEHLHWVRILGKRLRYALELFVDCCPPAARAQVYSHVEALQDILGLANDSYQAGLELEQLSDVIRATFPGAWELVRVGFSELQAFHQRRLKNQRAAFAKWWRQWELLRPAEVLIAPAKSAEAAVSLPAGH